MNSLPSEQRSCLSWLFALSGGLVLISGLVLIFTNPSEPEYEEFATEQLVLYAKENLCSTSSDQLEQIIQSQVCQLLVDTGKAKIPQLIRKSTKTRNYLLFTVFETDLLLYEFQTIGIFNDFYIIDVHQVYSP